MREFIALSETEPRMRAWLYPEDPSDSTFDPHVERADGWRVVIELAEGNAEPIRSTWEESLHEALRHVEERWPSKPVWRDFATGDVVQLR